MSEVTEIVYTWPDGREEVRYRRRKDSPKALELVNDVLDLQRVHGTACPYSFRHVTDSNADTSTAGE